MYRTKLERIPAATLEKLQNDIMCSGKTFPQLADIYGMFPDDIMRVAEGMGMHGLINNEQTVVTNVPKKEKVQHKTKRKTPVKITEELEKQIIEDLKKYQEKGWRNFTKKKILVKYNLTNQATLNKIADKYGIVFDYDVKSEPKVAVASSSDTIGLINDSEVIKFPEEEETTKVSVRLDNTFAIQGVQSYIYDKLSETKTDDLEISVKKYFDRNIINKKINAVKLYTRTGRYDKAYMVAMSKIIKSCCENRCNLTLVEGTTSTEIVTGYSSLTPNIQAIFDKCQEQKVMYKTDYETIKSAKTLYFVSIKFNYVKNNQCIVTDTLDKALLYLAGYEKATASAVISHSMFVSSVTSGKITPILKVIKGNI